MLYKVLGRRKNMYHLQIEIKKTSRMLVSTEKISVETGGDYVIIRVVQ